MHHDDEDMLHAIWSDPRTLEFLFYGDYTRELTQKRIADKRAHQAFHGFAIWTMLERETGDVVGDCGLQHLEDGPEIEIGWRVAPDRRDRGYATEAARAALAVGFRELGLERIVAVTDPRNSASRRVMEKLGMTFVGPGRHYGAETVLYEISGSG